MVLINKKRYHRIFCKCLTNKSDANFSFRYKCPKEDSSRNHYEPWELRIFENLECQWPMFYCYFVINAYFMGDTDTGEKYAKHLDVNQFRNICYVISFKYHIPETFGPYFPWNSARA